MLSHLLGIIQAFERNHGRRPQLIYLNQRHLDELMEECPGLFDSETAVPLGFRIMLVSEAELPHPEAVWLPPVVQTFRCAPRVSSALLASMNQQPHSAKGNKN